ncbi:Clp protease N-terminal domain-containing protein [Streptomyces sp. NRRL WC-3742]|uniref:Clp protease N-terminal domain-containing protein n=1 Tax=Streptomyces sp. NRRL WC-3742 TaxID=1463934 RepID=UPI0004C72051|nr:Clp protease N-terminal domain-containing protein [Streptomyces sp. NRRL WC-3742]
MDAKRWKRLLRPGGRLRRQVDREAERLGRSAPGTEHVLLALLAAREGGGVEGVLDERGGARLTALGLDYARARAALATETVALPSDPRSVEEYLAITDTGALVHSLLDDDTRARRLAEALNGGGEE